MTAVSKFVSTHATGLVILVLGAALGVMVLRLNAAQADRDLARAKVETLAAKLVQAEQAFQVEKASTDEAVADAKRIGEELLANERASSLALAGFRAETERYRQELSKCQTPDAVADRLRNLFPAVTP